MIEQLQTGFLDRYKSVLPKIYQISQFDESSAVRTTYLGNINMKKEDAFKVQWKFLLTDQSSTIASLLVGTNCKILLDSGARKSLCQRSIISKTNLVA